MRRAFLLPILLASTLALGSCTIVREGECNCDPDGGTGEPAVVDMLVLADLQLGTVNLAAEYGAFLEGITMGLAAQNVAVRKAALAPLHHTAAGGVPLLYGRGDEGSPFFSFGDAMAYWSTDPAGVLDDTATGEATNLAAIGTALGTLTLYRPEGEPPLDRPFFEAPADGFIVVYVSGTTRRCGYDDGACALSGTAPADWLTRAGDEGAEWLLLPGGTSVPPERIFHLALVSKEGVDFDGMAGACLAKPGFPAGAVDVLQPGGAEYYGPLVTELGRRGTEAAVIDVCTAFSQLAPIEILSITRKIAGMF